MQKLHCNECGTDFEVTFEVCPTCGCPKEECTPVNNDSSHTSASRSQGIDEQDFNEHYEYSPFSEGSSFLRAPWPLSKYPRRALAEEHPFLGWLFDPWHLTCRDESKREQYDTINNIFYLFNLFFKANFYAWCWTFFKTWYLWLLFIFVSTLSFVFGAGLFFVLCLVSLIHYCCGMGNALHRYWPSFHHTWRRVNKRYWKAMKE